jgi:tryptophanase
MPNGVELKRQQGGSKRRRSGKTQRVQYDKHGKFHIFVTVAKNVPGYDYAICKNIGRSASQIDVKFFTRLGRGPSATLSSPSVITCNQVFCKYF